MFACDYFLVKFRLINSQKRFSLVSTFFISLLLSFVNLTTNLNHFFCVSLKKYKICSQVSTHFVTLCLNALHDDAFERLKPKVFLNFLLEHNEYFFIEIDYEFLSLLFFNLLRFYAIT